MKNLKKTLMIFAVVLCMAICFFAVEASAGSINGLNYSISNGEAMITWTSVSGDLVIPESVTEDGVTYPVTKIDAYAFLGSSGITSVTFPDSITSIGEGAFYDCPSTGIPVYCSCAKNVADISIDPLSNGSISDTSKWTKVHSGDTKTVKENEVAGTCLQNGSYDSVVRCSACNAEISRETIAGEKTKNVNYTISDGVAIITSSSSASGDIVIPESVTEDGVTYLVTGISERAFINCTYITSVKLPETVTSIGKQAFYNCYDLKSINIPNGVTSINDGTFRCCTALTEITIPNGVTSIGENAFDGCTDLTSVTIPNTVTSIGYEAFDNCEALASITIPESVTSIGDRAFYGTGLESVIIPDSVTSIGEAAFECDESLTSVTIGKNVESIDNEAFVFCTSLASITVDADNSTFDSRNNCNAVINSSTNELVAGCKNTVIPDSVTSIGFGAFAGSAITDITIPGNVKSIGEYAIAYCAALKSVTISDGVESIGQMAFYECTALESVTIPGTVASTGEMAFYCCPSLTSVTIGDGVKSIGYGSFAGTALTSVTIPDSVTEIGEVAFYYCENITSVTIGNGVTSIADYAFAECTGITTVNYSCAKDVSGITISAEENPEIITDTTKWTKTHPMSDYVYNNDATCTADGTKTEQCACGEVKGETITATGTALGHDYTSVVTDPTCTEQGYTTYTCSRCSDSYKDTYTAALGHVDENGDNICDRCSADLTPASPDEDETGCHWCYMKTQTTSILHLIYSLVDFIHHALGVFSNMFD